MNNETSRLVAGRYRLGTKLGSGAMGVVWLARDERLHRTVAIKQLLLQPGLPAQQAEQARQRALREGRIAARLQHAGAVTVHDVVTDDGDPWLVMEYLPSSSLAQVLQEHGTLSAQRVAGIGAQAAAALAAAHQAGIVHRDVKPGNVLLGEQGLVKITDFGISRAIGDITVTATGLLAGTPAYLAPELARGAEPEPPSDVYSLGATLYTAVEGEPPCGRGENQLALLHAVAAGRLNPPRRAGALTPVLNALLRNDPAQRPEMREVGAALAAVAADRVVPEALLSPAKSGDPGGREQGAVAGRQQVARQPESRTPQPRQPDARQTDRPPPTPPRQQAVSRPPGYPPPEPTRQTAPPAPAQWKPQPNDALRRMLLAVLAIVAAIAVGIGVASLFLQGTQDSGMRSRQAAAAMASWN